MKITLKDGSCKEYAEPMAIIDIAKDISEGLARVACVAELDGEVVDLRTVVDGEHELNILTFDSDAGKAAYRHTASHVLAQAVKRLYPHAKCAIGPAIEDGFYYDFDMESLDREALDKIEKEMNTGSYRFAAKDQKLITCSVCKVFLLDRLFRFLYNHSGMVMICF